MENFTHFSSSYINWLALMWQSLEHIQEWCARRSSGVDALLSVRLEILLMEQVAGRCLRNGYIAGEQHRQISVMLAELRALLDVCTDVAMECTRIHAAQDRIYDEVITTLSQQGQAQISQFMHIRTTS